MFCVWTVPYNSHITIEHLKLVISNWGNECFELILMNSSAKSHMWLVATLLEDPTLVSCCLPVVSKWLLEIPDLEVLTDYDLKERGKPPLLQWPYQPWEDSNWTSLYKSRWKSPGPTLVISCCGPLNSLYFQNYFEFRSRSYQVGVNTEVEGLDFVGQSKGSVMFWPW